MVDQGNGSFKNVCTPKYKNVTKYRTVTQTKYCTDPVYEKFCDYETYVWKQIDQRSTSGGEAKSGRLPWPEIRLETLDREIRQESYSAVLSYPHKDKTETSKIDINTESEFMTWKMNEKIKVFRRNAGGLAKWERAQ